MRPAAAVFAVVILVTSAAAALAAEPAPATVRCEISAERQGQRVVVGATITADAPVTGTYRLRTARGTGAAEARSGEAGSFTAGPDRPARVGNLAVDAPDAVDATLTATWSGGSARCAGHAGPP